MQGQRIIQRLTGTNGLTKRELKKRVSAKYRKEAFESDYDLLFSQGTIEHTRVGRVRLTVLKPIVADIIKVGDRVQVSYDEYPTYSGWTGPAVVKDIWTFGGQPLYSAGPEGGEFQGERGGFYREHLTLLAPEPTIEFTPPFFDSPSASESLQAELEPIPEAPKVLTVSDFPIGARIRVLPTYPKDAGKFPPFTDRIGKLGTVIPSPFRQDMFVTVNLDSGNQSALGAPFYPEEIEIVEDKRVSKDFKVGDRVRVVYGSPEPIWRGFGTVEGIYPDGYISVVHDTQGKGAFISTELERA